MTKKNIAILKMRLSGSGGLEKQTRLILNALIKKGDNVTVVTTLPKSEARLTEHISYHFIKKGPVCSFFRILFFNWGANRWITKNKPNIILGIDRTTDQTHIRAGNGLHKAYLKNRRKYCGIFDHLISKLNPLHHLILHIEKRSFQNAKLKKIIVNSNMVSSQIIEHYKVSPEKITVIHNGVEWERTEGSFKQSFEEKEHLAKKMGLDPDKFNFLFVGNGYKRKGLDRALQAMSKLKGENFHLLIVGKDKNIKRYERYAQKLGLSSKTSFFGQQPTLELFYQIADALILPPYYDPFANVSLEALSMGLFTITSKENGACEIINDRNGVVINNLNDPDEIKQSLEIALKNKKNEERAKQIRESVKELDIASYLDKIIKTLT